MKLAITLVTMTILITVSCATVTIQLTVFCNGGVVYDNAVTLDKPSPTALDAIKASEVAYTGYDSGWGVLPDQHRRMQWCMGTCILL